MLVNGPVVNRALLNALFPPGRSAATPARSSSTTPTAPCRIHQLTLGYQRQLNAQMALTVDYVHSWNRDQLINFDLNPAQRVDTTRTGRIVYTDLDGSPPAGDRPVRQPGDHAQERRLVAVRRRELLAREALQQRWQARVSYALGYARGNSEANQTRHNNYQVLGDPNLDATSGRSTPTGGRTSSSAAASRFRTRAG